MEKKERVSVEGKLGNVVCLKNEVKRGKSGEIRGWKNGGNGCSFGKSSGAGVIRTTVVLGGERGDMRNRICEYTRDIFMKIGRRLVVEQGSCTQEWGIF